MRFLIYWLSFIGVYYLNVYIDQCNGHVDTRDEKVWNLVLALGCITIVLLCSIKDDLRKWER